MSVTMEAEAILMPLKAKEAVALFGLGLQTYVLSSGGLTPSPDAVSQNFVETLRRVGGARADLEWLVDAEYMYAESLLIWDRGEK